MLFRLINVETSSKINLRSIAEMNLFSSAIARINSFFHGLQVKRFLAVALVGLVLLTANVDTSRTYGMKSDSKSTLNDPDRPQTTREWKQEARATEDAPDERIKKIGQETGDALKEFGQMYQDTAKRSAQELKDS
jgi:hypothetical protein